MKVKTLKSMLLSMAMTCSLFSCVNGDYDLSDVDTTVGVKINDLTIPLNLDEVTLKSVLELEDDSQIKEVNGEYAVIEVGSMGMMRYTTGFRSQVLSVPLRALHQADGKSFVYVLGENNMREMKWVETGLVGDDKVEILSGLQEGERVIIK
jgi:hypothetical protein